MSVFEDEWSDLDDGAYSGGQGAAGGGDGWFGPLEAGAAYALYRHGQDRQVQQLAAAMGGRGGRVDLHVHTSEQDMPGIPPVNALDFTTEDIDELSWDDFIGQEGLKRTLNVAIHSAQQRGEPLDHVILGSPRPGVGKTTVARLIAKTLGARITELVPPFNVYTLVAAAEQLGDGDVLFIDEVHKLADAGKKGAEVLLKVLEDHVAYLPDGRVVPLARITVVAASTEVDALPEPVLDRFKHRPFFGAYSELDLIGITMRFVSRHDCFDQVTDEVAVAIADACRETPRVVDEMVIAARDLSLFLGRPCTSEELLQHLEVEPDGLTRTHAHYLTAMRQYFGRKPNADGEIDYIAGEAAMAQLLRETKAGISRVERFLVERGYLDRTPRGRQLTERGIEKAEELIAAGKGASDV